MIETAYTKERWEMIRDYLSARGLLNRQPSTTTSEDIDAEKVSRDVAFDLDMLRVSQKWTDSGVTMLAALIVSLERSARLADRVSGGMDVAPGA